MQFDPRLRLRAEDAYDIEVAVSPMFEPVSAFLTDHYTFPLTAEIIGDDIRIRAATGDEATDLLTTGGDDEEDGMEWPGDPAAETGHEIVWQETVSSAPNVEPACHLWAGEVLFRSGGGQAGPFFIHEQAARAWAFSTALGPPEGEVFEAQVVPYACARSCAPALLRGGEPEFRRVGRFWASPVRPWGEPEVLPLPARK